MSMLCCHNMISYGPTQTLNADDVTPSVKGFSSWTEAYTINRNVTNFDDGVDGQIIALYATSGNLSIINDNTKIKTVNGADISPLSANRLVIFQLRGSVWHQLGVHVNVF